VFEPMPSASAAARTSPNCFAVFFMFFPSIKFDRIPP
jgi:hypothetical protein